MKRSEIYHKAMLAVVNSPSMSGEDKLEVLDLLASEKRLAVFSEEMAEKTIDGSKIGCVDMKENKA